MRINKKKPETLLILFYLCLHGIRADGVFPGPVTPRLSSFTFKPTKQNQNNKLRQNGRKSTKHKPATYNL